LLKAGDFFAGDGSTAKVIHPGAYAGPVSLYLPPEREGPPPRPAH